MKTLLKKPASTHTHQETKEPFFNKTAQVKDTETGGLMTRHLTSDSDVANLGKETSSPFRSTDFFGGKDTFFR